MNHLRTPFERVFGLAGLTPAVLSGGQAGYEDFSGFENLKICRFKLRTITKIKTKYILSSNFMWSERCRSNFSLLNLPIPPQDGKQLPSRIFDLANQQLIFAIYYSHI